MSKKMTGAKYFAKLLEAYGATQRLKIPRSSEYLVTQKKEWVIWRMVMPESLGVQASAWLNPLAQQT
jgi:hypothetical protein